MKVNIFLVLLFMFLSIQKNSFADEDFQFEKFAKNLESCSNGKFDLGESVSGEIVGYKNNWCYYRHISKDINFNCTFAKNELGNISEYILSKKFKMLDLYLDVISSSMEAGYCKMVTSDNKEISSYEDSVEILVKNIKTCKNANIPYEHPMLPISGFHKILGMENGKCIYQNVIAGKVSLDCKFPNETLSKISELYKKTLDINYEAQDAVLLSSSIKVDGKVVNSNMGQNSEVVDVNSLADIYKVYCGY